MKSLVFIQTELLEGKCLSKCQMFEVQFFFDDILTFILCLRKVGQGAT